MNLTQLHTFSVVSRTLSFTEAAQQLCLSQPAVSRQMAALEEEIGTALFSRSHSTIELTTAGAHLNQQLPPILRQLQILLQETRRIGSGEIGQLRIGLLEDQCLDEIISAALRQLQQADVYLSIQRLNFRELETKLLGGEIDIAISIEQSPDAFPGCSRNVYSVESMCLAVHRDCLPPCEIHSSTDLGLLTAPILVPSLDSFQRSQYDALKALIGRGWSDSQEYDFSSIAPMVSAGLAATIANESHNLSVDQSVALLPMGELPGVNKGIFWLSENKNPMIKKLESLL